MRLVVPCTKTDAFAHLICTWAHLYLWTEHCFRYGLTCRGEMHWFFSLEGCISLVWRADAAAGVRSKAPLPSAIDPDCVLSGLRFGCCSSLRFVLKMCGVCVCVCVCASPPYYPRLLLFYLLLRHALQFLLICKFISNLFFSISSYLQIYFKFIFFNFFLWANLFQIYFFFNFFLSANSNNY